MELNIILPDGRELAVPEGKTAGEILKEFAPKYLKNAVAVRLNDEVLDLNRPLHTGGKLSVLTFDDPEGREIFWHSSAHLMAQAVKELFPDAKLAIGPPIKEGFYYDIDMDRTLTPEDLREIEARMQQLVKEALEIIREDLPINEAVRLFKEMGEDYKIEILSEIEDDSVSVYRQGDFADLCRGPHLPNTRAIKYPKLLSIAGAYWRGDEHNKMLQRIYGTAFPKKSLLEEYLNRLEEAKRRDHRKLGKELDLFSINEAVGPGLILWHPKGAFIRNAVETFWREAHFKAGYDLLYTPHIARLDLWRTSGHLDFYRESMFSPMQIDEVEYQLKPMNCPFHIQIYKSQLRSYRNLPLRWAELGTVYRYERSGVLHGLMRVRGFTQDDAHIFCRPDQIESEIVSVLDFTLFFLRTFGFEKFNIYLSTQPEKFVGTQESWEIATEALRRALEKKGVAYQVDPGEGVFYGPKIDIKIQDVLNREWQCTTIQVDFNLPERFNVNYIGEDGQSHRTIMIHRALLGSLERFFGILIEHYGGAFPMWLAPVQAAVLPITERHHEYAAGVAQALTNAGVRVFTDDRNEKVGYKIREAETQKIPYMIIIGDKEVEQDKISYRKRHKGDQGQIDLKDFIVMIAEEIAAKKITD
ncbi:threonine--tRNA ligase [bacterium BMS3Bbin03]|nr:threonine--tRNA ligase [bacterium BMS3Bbin03]